MKSGRCNVNCQHSSNIFVFPQSTCWHGDSFELCMSCLLSVSVGLILDAASPVEEKTTFQNICTPLHCTGVSIGQLEEQHQILSKLLCNEYGTVKWSMN